jgi:5-methylcytosine-specific restriction endonuclease McrA
MANAANNGSKWISKKKRHAIYMRDELSCIYCGDGPESQILTLDHLIPQELGGENNVSNLVTCCKSCNCMKGSKTIRQFFVYLRDRGINTDLIAKRIQRNVKRKLKGIGRYI